MGARAVYGSWALAPEAALVIAVMLAVVLSAGIVVAFLRSRRRLALARIAEASASEAAPPLVESAEVALSGIVRHHEASKVAVKVSVRQTGTEAKFKGAWSYTWKETSRETVVAPFFLELATGERVLVQPPKDVELADGLDQRKVISRTERVLSAELTEGERVFARGRLERSDLAAPASAYREVAWGWALGPANGRMLLSSEPLGSGLRKRARFHRTAGWIAAAVLLATQLVLVPYYSRLAGTTEVAAVTGTPQHWSHKGGRTCKATVLGEDSEVDCDARVTTGDLIAIRVGSIRNWQLGREATVDVWLALILGGVATAFWIAYAVRRRWTRPWWRRKLEESGGGRLPGRDR